MDSQKDQELRATYECLPEEEIADLYRIKSSLTKEAVAALEHVIDSRLINVEAIEHELAASQEIHSAQRTKRSYAEAAANSLAMVFGISLGPLFAPAGAIIAGLAVIIFGFIGWKLSSIAVKATTASAVSKKERLIKVFLLCIAYLFLYLLILAAVGASS